VARGRKAISPLVPIQAQHDPGVGGDTGVGDGVPKLAAARDMMRKSVNTEKDKRNYFCIVAAEKRFDVDKYVKQSPLTITRTWHRGEPLYAGSETCQDDSGLAIDLGIGSELGIDEQQTIAAAYLKRNESSLKELRAAVRGKIFYLGLQEAVDPKSLGSIMDVSPALMRRALELRIGVTIWACVR